jgi:hypothetical protein
VFKEIKDRVTKDLVLKEADSTKEFKIYIDALDNIVGGELT